MKKLSSFLFIVILYITGINLVSAQNIGSISHCDKRLILSDSNIVICIYNFSKKPDKTFVSCTFDHVKGEILTYDIKDSCFIAMPFCSDIRLSGGCTYTQERVDGGTLTIEYKEDFFHIRIKFSSFELEKKFQYRE